MPWVLGEYLSIVGTSHDHEFAVRWWETNDAAIRWGQSFGVAPNTMMRVIVLPGGGATTRPAHDWVMVRPARVLYHHDGIARPAATPSGFRWLANDRFAFTGYGQNNITVRRWRIYEDGSMNHDCNPNRTWRSRPFSGMVSTRGGRASTPLTLYCLNCAAHVGRQWLRTRATNIASRGGE